MKTIPPPFPRPDWFAPARLVITILVAVAGLERLWAAAGPGVAPPGEHASAAKAVSAQVEGDWSDGRWNQTEVGPFLASSLRTPSGSIAKALSIRVGEHREAAVCYDTAAPAFRGAWTPGFLKFSANRFGLLDAPAIEGKWAISLPLGMGWENVPARHHALHRNGGRVVLESLVGGSVVLESPWFETRDGFGIFTRSFEIAPHAQPLSLRLFEQTNAVIRTEGKAGVVLFIAEREGSVTVLAGSRVAGTKFTGLENRVSLFFKPNPELARFRLFLWSGPAADLPRLTDAISVAFGPPEDLAKLARPGPSLWVPGITNVGRVGFPTDGFAVDTLTAPYANPWKALLFCSGVDFFSDGAAAVCTIHGDVWRVTGLDETLRAVTWKRFATGLFQPLGLRVVDDRVYVLGRDQITALEDENGDGEADRYENFSNLIQTSVGGHDYVTCLERDGQGNFYYVDPRGVHRVAPDGQSQQTLASGFRNPNGLGVREDGLVTVTPQQGNWTPSSCIVEVQQDGYYGYAGPRVTEARPLGYDAPLCWLPHSFDNSSSSEVWVPNDHWGALGGHMLHFAWGRCSMMMVMRDVVDGRSQGAAVALPVHFLSGPMRGAFSRRDGHLYVAGSTGWQTSAAKDGSFQRVRYTGSPLKFPVAWHAQRNGLTLTFSHALDRATAEDAGSYGLHQWNYRYSREYGSKDYSVAQPGEEGRDEVEIRAAHLLPDGKTVFLETAELHPVMQVELKFNLTFADRSSSAQVLYLTLNRLAVPVPVPASN